MRDPLVVIVGRPNVGKSLLFNRLRGQRDSIVHASPGMTLDYLSGPVMLPDGARIDLADTGGIAGEEGEWSDAAAERMRSIAERADAFLVVVDARAGWRHGDGEVLDLLRRSWPSRPRILTVNKAEGMPAAQACSDFYAVKEDMIAVSARRGDGLVALRRKIADLPPVSQAHEKSTISINKELQHDDFAENDFPEMETSPVAQKALPLTIIGRPNVGKSTLLNRLLGHDRALVSDIPGTTRDSVREMLSSPQGDFILVDTAGMRRRRAAGDIHKLGVAAARESIRQAAAVFLVWDMGEGILHQDKRLAVLAAEAGCGVVALGNKCDLLPPSARGPALRKQAEELQLGFDAPSFAVSALSRRIPRAAMLDAAAKAAAASSMAFSTAALNRALSAAVRRNPPPTSGGIRPKLRYAHQGGKSPLRIVVHGGGVARIGESYRRYLAAAMSRGLSVRGAPLRIDFRAEENPYHDRRAR